MISSKTMIISSALILLNIWTFNSSANNLPATNQKLLSMLPQTCVFSGSFKQNRELVGLPVPLVSQGRFFFSCEQGLIWQTQSPINETLIYTKAQLHFSLDQNNELQVADSLIHNYLGRLLLSLMGGDIEYLQKNFAISEDQSKHALTLKPSSTALKRALQDILLQRQDKTATTRITDTNQQITLIETLQLQEFSAQLETACQSVFGNSDKICAALKNPQKYQTTEAER